MEKYLAQGHGSILRPYTMTMVYGPRAATSVCHDREPNIFSHLAQPNLVSIFSYDQFGDKFS